MLTPYLKPLKLNAISLFLIAGVFIIPSISLKYFSFEIVGILQSKAEFLLQNWGYRIGLYTHIAGGMLALIAGLPQLSAPLRKRSISTHRWVGKLYVCAVFVTAVGALVVVPFTYGGWIPALGLTILALLCLSTTFQGIRYIYQKNVYQHQRWMLRSYALIFSSVTFRIILLMTPLLGVKFLTTYHIATWFSWIINLTVVEIHLYRTRVVSFTSTRV